MPLVAAILLEGHAQVAVVVERFDDRAGEHVVARLERQHVSLAVQVRAQAHVGGDHVEHAEVALAALLAQARGRLLPALALVGRIGDRRHRLEIDAPRLAVAGRRGIDLGRVVRRVLDLEKRIAAHRVVHFLGEIERGELQQPDGVLQPRRDGVLLALAGLQGRQIHRSLRSKRRS